MKGQHWIIKLSTVKKKFTLPDDSKIGPPAHDEGLKHAVVSRFVSLSVLSERALQEEQRGGGVKTRVRASLLFKILTELL